MFNDDIYVTLLLGIFSCWILHNLSLSPACLRALGVVFYTQKHAISRAFTSFIYRLYPRFTWNGGFSFWFLFTKLFLKNFLLTVKTIRGITRQNRQNISSFKSWTKKLRGFQTVWFLSKYKNFIDSNSLICRLAWAQIFKLLRSPRIDSKGPIPPGCVAWRAGTTTLYSYSVPSPHRLFKNSSTEQVSYWEYFEAGRSRFLHFPPEPGRWSGKGEPGCSAPVKVVWSSRKFFLLRRLQPAAQRAGLSPVWSISKTGPEQSWRHYMHGRLSSGIMYNTV